MKQAVKSVARSVIKGLGVNAYEWRYARAGLQKYALGLQTDYDVDVAYVHPATEVQGWILDTFCDEIARYGTASWTSVAADADRLPRAKAYFHSHFFIFRRLLFRFPEIAQARNVVLFTHPQEDAIEPRELRKLLNSADSVASMCSQFRDLLIDVGVDESRVTVVLAGADPHRFPAHERQSRPVGLCSGFRRRKNPDLLLQIVQAAAHRKFHLIGRHWTEWSGFEALNALPNFCYQEQVPYEQMPDFYSEIDVLLSPSSLEGGPMPVLEAMMCNVVPVASRIGFCPDLINNGQNGFLFDMEDSPESIVRLIDDAYELKSDVRSTVEHLTWQHYSETVRALIAAEPAQQALIQP